MYRSIIFLLVLCSLSKSHHRCHGDHDCKVNYRLNRHSNRKYEKLFDKVSRSLINAEREVHHGCGGTTSNPVREVLNTESYVLKYKLPEFAAGDISIKIKHRVIYLSASISNGLSFRDVRILPQIVNTHSAQWYIEDGDVNVMFRYKSPINSVTTTICEENIDETILSVPAMVMSSSELRNGDIASALQLPSNVTFGENA